MSPVKLRSTFRNSRSLKNLTVDGGPNPVYDWNSNPAVLNKKPHPAKAYQKRDLDKTRSQRLLSLEESHHDEFFGDLGHFRGKATKEEVKSIVGQLFKAKEVLQEEEKEKEAEEEKKEEGEAGETLWVEVDHAEIVTPRATVESTELLTAKFSSPEHIASKKWHEETLGFVTSSQRNLASPVPLDDNKHSSLFARSAQDVFHRPDKLYGAGSGSILRAGAAMSGSDSDQLRLRTMSELLAREGEEARKEE